MNETPSLREAADNEYGSGESRTSNHSSTVSETRMTDHWNGYVNQQAQVPKRVITEPTPT